MSSDRRADDATRRPRSEDDTGRRGAAAPAAPGPAGREVEVRVPAERDGLRLDHFLTAVLPDLSRSRIQRLIHDGLVRLPARHIRPSTPVRRGDVVSVSIPRPAPATPTAEPLDIRIVHDDPDLVVVDKPAGMVVHPAAGHATGTLVNALLHHVQDLSGVGGVLRPGIVHRLDRGTSGLLVVAKHDSAHDALAAQFRHRDVGKEYSTLVWGVVQAGRRIEEPIGRHPRDRQKMTTRARRARSAVTRITKAEHLRGISLLHVAITTGRTHQIRVHLSAIGHPVVGDPVYGGIRRHLPAHLRALGRLERPFLHASRLAFRHPRDGRAVEFTSPLPADLQGVLDEIRRQADGRRAVNRRGAP